MRLPFIKSKELTQNFFQLRLPEYSHDRHPQTVKLQVIRHRKNQKR